MGNELVTVEESVNKHFAQEAKKNLKGLVDKHKVAINPSMQMTVIKDDELSVRVPSSMHKLQAAFNLIKQFEEEETYRVYSRVFPGIFLNDFQATLQDLIHKVFGQLQVSKLTTDGAAAGNDYIQIPVGYDPAGREVTKKGYIGSIIAPPWDSCIIDILPNNMLKIRAKLKFEESVNNFLETLARKIKAESVVSGRCIQPEPKYNAQDVLIGLVAKPFLPKENPRMVLNDNVRRQIDNLIIPTLKMKAKKSLLFAGDFGTGKTETAIKVGIVGARDFGRTFFYLHNSELLTLLLPYLKNYDHSIVFTEDVDQVSAGDRDSAMNDLLNQIDGSEIKNIDCTFIFTTNSEDKIHPAMRRPGRIDQVIFFAYPDKKSIKKIYELYAEGFDGSEAVDFDKCATETPDNVQGAVVAEIAKRACNFATELHGGVLSTEEFLDAIAGMVDHIKFMKNEQHKGDSVADMQAKIMQLTLQKAFPGVVNAFGNPTFIDK